jgi:hypothetical protein
LPRQLVFVHGRSQQHKNASDLKRAWITAWQSGLAKSGLEVPIDESDIRFPYYGDTLFALVDPDHAGEIPSVLVRGAVPDEDAAQQEFVAAVAREAQQALGIPDESVDAAATAVGPQERGPQNWRWVHAVLTAIDTHLPAGSGLALSLATHDVYRYLHNQGIRDAIDEGVRAALSGDQETVVVGHSLGSVVTYNLLAHQGSPLGWRVPLYVTVGCPLGISAIRRTLAPVGHPECAPRWFNARDNRDVVALFSLDPGHFNVDPAVENKDDVLNDTANRHGISGYLSDAEVAKRVHDAVVG